jgi:hypothetical protein
VIIPFGGSRSTLCISSQVGCKQGESIIRWIYEKKRNGGRVI